MNLLASWLGQPLLRALGWALIAFLWQGAAVALLLAATLALLRKRAASLRYLVACFGMVGMLALPIATFSRQLRSAAEPTPAATGTPQQISTLTMPALPHMTAVSDARTSPEAIPLTTWVVSLWLFGVLALSLRFLGGWSYAQCLRRWDTETAPPEWGAMVERLARRLGIRSRVRLLESFRVGVPTALGALRPLILLPVGALSGLTAGQIEALLAHELAHIRRHDYAVNLFQTVAETFLFYHPAVWWVSHRIRVERENCCDDVAVMVSGDALIYARALAELEATRGSAPRLAVAASGGSLLGRVCRLLGLPADSVGSTRRAAGMLSMAGILILLVATRASTPAQAAVIADPLLDSAVALAAPASSARPSLAARKAARACPASRAAASKARACAGSSRSRRPAAVLSPGIGGGIADGVPGGVSAGVRKGVPGGISGAVAEGVAASPSDPASDSGGGPSRVESPAHADFIDGLAALGFRNLSVPQLVSLRNLGVTPGYISAMRQRGLPLRCLDEIRAARIQGLTPQDLDDWNAAGYDHLAIDELLALKVQGVTADYAERLRALGYEGLSVKDLLALRVQGVTPSYAMALRALGLASLSVERLLSLRVQGVTPGYVAALGGQGYHNLSVEQLLSLKVQGVTPEYVAGMRALGYTQLTVDDLISLKVQGITPAFVRAVKRRGFDRLTVDELIALKQKGIVS